MTQGISIGGTRSALAATRTRLYLWLFLTGFCWAILQLVVGLHAAEFSPAFETISIAHRLATSGEFADPFITPTGPTAHVAPVYPFLMAIVFNSFPRLAANLIITTLNAALLGLEMCLTAALSASVFGSVRPGVFGALLLAAATRLLPQHDALFSGVLLLSSALALLAANPLRAGWWSGISVLTNPVSALAVSVLAIVRGWKFAALAGAIALAICFPWIVRNWIVLGSPYFVRDNFGLELALSNFDAAQPELAANPGLWKHHPSRNPTEASYMAALGEPVYYRQKLHAGLHWIAAHPRKFIELCWWRIFYYWFPSSREGWPAGVYRALFLLAAAGAWFSRKNPQAMILAAAACAYSLPYILVQTDIRYPVPTLWVLALLSGYAVHVLVLNFRRGRLRG